MEYYVVIRTLGTGGDKYRELLDSIYSQTIKPSGVYVFIAEGYKLPLESSGKEKYVYTKKGMWHQRVYGMQYVADHHPYSFQLVCDDDVSFESDFVEKMFENIKGSDADIMIPGVGQVGCFKRNLKLGLIGSRYETNNDKYRIKIANTAGFIVSKSRDKNIIPTQSGPFQCFMMSSKLIASLNLEEENWLDDTKYALPDDQVFFYKCFLNGIRQLNCINPNFKHLDHGSSSPTRTKDAAYASGRNFFIFWHRFLYIPANLLKKPWLLFCINYRILAFVLLYLVKGVCLRDFQILKSYCLGVRDGFYFIYSKEYESLPLMRSKVYN